MAVSRILKSGSLAALAAGLAALALPSAAMADENHGERHGGYGANRDSGDAAGTGSRSRGPWANWRSRSGETPAVQPAPAQVSQGERGTWRGERSGERSQPAPPPPPPPVVQQAPQTGDNPWRGPERSSGRSGWNQGSVAPAVPPPSVDTGRREWRGERGDNGGWNGRSRSYADGDRDRANREERRNDDSWRRDGRTGDRRVGERWRSDNSVSYTHLTLPTNREV